MSPWSSVLEKLRVADPVKKFSTFVEFENLLPFT
jgi:hypothetical protein